MKCSRFMMFLASIVAAIGVPAFALELNHDPIPARKPATVLLPGQYPTGLNLPPSMRGIKPGSLQIKPRAGVMAASDPAFDWTPQLMSVRNQNPTGTCWAFASLGAFESRRVLFEGASKDTTNFSEQDMVNYFPDGPNAGGNQFMAFSYLAQHGAAEEAVESWLGLTIPQAWKPANARLLRAKEMVVLGDLQANTPQNIQAIKNALSYGPVYTGLSISRLRAWAASQGHGGGGEDTWWGSQVVPGSATDPDDLSDHAVCIVGWDDTKLQYGGAASGAWKIRNSWGSSWGSGGYSWVGYGAANIGESTSYVPTGGTERKDSRTTILANDFSWFSSFGADVSTVYALAKFTVPALPYGINELQAIEVGVQNPNTTCQVEVYSAFDGNNTTGLLASGNQTLVNAGYYAINLTEPVRVTEGQTLAFRVRLSTPGITSYQFASNNKVWSSNVSGRYYYSFSGTAGTWSDVATDGATDPQGITNELVVRGRIQRLNTAGARHWLDYQN